MAEEKKKKGVNRFVPQVEITPQLIVRTAITLALIILMALMFPRGVAIETEYRVGTLWAQQDLFAPFSFPIQRDPIDYAQEVEESRRNVLPVFERNQAGSARQQTDLKSFFERLAGARSARSRIATGGSVQDSALYRQRLDQLGVRLFDREWEVLDRLTEKQIDAMRETVLRAAEKYLAIGILDVDKQSLNRQEMALRRGSLEEEVVPVTRFYDQNEIATLIENDIAAGYTGDKAEVEIAHKIAMVHLSPNIQFNQSATDFAAQAAVDAVPRTMGFVQEGDRIVGKNDRITSEIKQKLDSLRKARAERGDAIAGPLQYLGILMHVGVVIVLFGIYLRLFRKRIFSDNRRLALIALVFLMTGFFAYLSRTINVAAPVEYLIFVPAASMLLTIIFDSRVGFYGTIIIAYLVAGIRANDYTVALTAMVAGALAVYTVRDVRNRSQIIRSFGFILLGYAITIIALGLERIAPWTTMMEELVFALANSVISPVLTFGLLIFFERYFKVTTDLTLIELGHFNHPLLKLLAEKAPGTYHHSAIMASLAEAAASAVGANEVLARVGAYFHDIGKIEKPTYFVENQKGSRNRHEKLSPRMSSLIIQNHVKKGMSFAREYKLPEEVVAFIPQHHGTTRIDYFYSKAVKLAENSDDETKIDEIKEQDYRYPGPKPQTKETGILMLADSIEAAARTIEDPSPQKLEVLIDDLIKKRFEEGELDECPLTLKDLTKIKKAFLGVLVGVHHGRVKYPGADRERREPEDGKGDRQRGERSEGEERTQQGSALPSLDSDEETMSPDQRLTRTIKDIDNQ